MGKLEQHTFAIEGMTCTNCALGLKRYLEKKGVEKVDVSFPNAEATFESDQDILLDDLIKGIEGLGFQVVTEEEAFDETAAAWSPLEWKVFVCSVFTIPLFFSMFLPFPILHLPAVQLLLCLPVFIIGLNHFGVSAVKSLKTGVPNMDVLIAIGSTAAFLYSLVGFTFALGHRFMFWETAATIITLVLIGNLMEHRAVKQTTSALRALTKLQPRKVKRVSTNAETGVETIEEVDYKTMRVGHTFLVNTGDRIPTDGVVVWGNGSANEAMMTGESLLVDKEMESEVIGGAVLELGSIKMKATRIGKDTTLSKIIQLVKSAQADQPPIQKLADKISAVFVPIVLCIAAVTFAVWYFVLGGSFQVSMLNSIAVLVISCPCAMGLATPTALMVGLGRAAKNGILIKGGQTLETVSTIKNIVFDKTGTLTTGFFTVKDLYTTLDKTEFMEMLLGLERYSTHPLATGIVRSWSEKVSPLVMATVKEMKGIGIMGKDAEGNTYMAGAYGMAAEFTKEDQHNVYVLKNGHFVGWVDMADELRSDAVQCIDYMKDNNIRTLLISGDNEEKTTYIARKLGIPEYYARKLPKEKLDMIDELNASGTTLMVGDGVNDAPALAKASIGVALSNASQVAIDAADVVLINSNLRSLNTAIGIAKHTVITIKQNLFWAFFYNVLAIPIAAAGFLNPMLAALAMAFSDVIVIGNSLRLKRKKIQ